MIPLCAGRAKRYSEENVEGENGGGGGGGEETRGWEGGGGGSSRAVYNKQVFFISQRLRGGRGTPSTVLYA